MCNRRRSRYFMAILLAVSLLAVSLLAVACFQGEPERTFDVALAVDMPDSVQWAQPFRIVYRWVPGESIPDEPGDFLVFVHFVDPEGQIVAQDDHAPAVPTSQWREGQPVEYRRWFRIPKPGTYEYVDVIIGLYDDESGRVAVRSRGRWETDALVHRLRASEEGYDGTPVGGDGWYRLQGRNSGRDIWHWTAETATVSFLNPGRDAELLLEASSPVGLLGGPQRVRLFLNDKEISELLISQESRFVERIPISLGMLGTRPVLEIKIEVDPAVIPAEVEAESEDSRLLGLKVFSIHLSPR